MIAKRMLDLIGATVGVLLLSPVLVFIALCVKCDSPGPALFRQQRVGRWGCSFEILKFRTMSIRREGSDLAITVGADPRITRVGKFLRKYKLDELPQLVNVLRGEMSFVGPRPEVPKYVALYTDEERAAVMSLRPGITDPASMVFANESELLGQAADPEATYVNEILPTKLRLYQDYVGTRTFFGDLRIIFQTLVIACVGSNRRSTT